MRDILKSVTFLLLANVLLADVMERKYTCGAQLGTMGPFYNIEILVRKESEVKYGMGTVLMQKYWYNPEGNHAFAPDMIFVRDFFTATVQYNADDTHYSDPSGASLKIKNTSLSSAQSDVFAGELVLKGNRNMRRTFEVTEPLQLQCRQEKPKLDNKAVFESLYQK